MDADRCSLSISHLPELTRRRGVATCRYIAPGCMADADLTARLFASGVLEASVAYVQRARTSDVSPHVSVNRGVGQFIAGVASTAEGRARLLTTEGVEDALMWLLEYGGEPVGIAENRTLADPRGMAGLSLALLRGREEDAQIALPAKVVHQIVSMIDTYYDLGAVVVLPCACVTFPVRSVCLLLLSAFRERSLTVAVGCVPVR
jgi:hypothetical protein